MAQVTLGSILRLINDPARRREYRRKGKAAVLAATGKSANACAATASQPLIELGLLKRPVLGAQALADQLQIEHDWQSITDKHAVQPGDLIVCEDGNGNGVSDHVWWSLSVCNGKGYALCFDNQSQLGLSPYWRNLGQGSKTPMAYALRQPQ